jgi:hypothetical protein
LAILLEGVQVMDEDKTTSLQEAALNIKQKCVVITMNLLLLAELTYSIYRGNQSPEEMVIVFLKTFLPLVVGTLILARIFLRKLAGSS